MGVQGGGGGGGGASQGYNYSGQLSQAMQSIWGPQGEALAGMYGGVSNLMNSQAGQIGGAARDQAGQVMPYAQQGLANLAQYANPNNGLAQQQLSQYSQQVGQEFGRNIMPQIKSGAGLGGNMGGSRMALAQGVAAGDASRAIAQGGTDLYAQQYQLAAQAAQALPGAASQVYNLGMQPWQAQWAPYTAAAGIFGSPQALTRQQNVSMGENWNNQKQNAQKGSWGFNLM
jgi:hypothetical protein